MANEITFSSGIQILKGSLNRNINSTSLQADMAGSRVVHTTQAVGTTYEAVVVTDLASAGYARFQNNDATNYVEIGVEVAAAFYPLVRIDAGKTAGPFRLSTLTIFARANTAAVNMDVFIAEA